MSGGDTTRKNAEPTAVRALPSEGIYPLRGDPAPTQPSEGSRRWAVPLMIVGTTLLLLLVIANPIANPDTDDAPTTAPPLLAAVTADAIDLRLPIDNPATRDWSTTPLDESDRIVDILVFDNSLVAIGSTRGEARAWLSITGADWSVPLLLDVPEGDFSRIDHAVVWQDRIVALGDVDGGVGVWTAMHPSTWIYRGVAKAIDTTEIMSLVAGKDLLVVSSREGQLEGWTSPDALNWAPTGPFQGLETVRVRTVAANEDWYFVGGEAACEREQCRPVIYRSRDAINWEPTTGALPSGPVPGVLAAESGFVIDITSVPAGLIAVGRVGSPPYNDIALWTSTDGDTWARFAESEPLLQSTSATLELLDLDLRNEPSAHVLVDGEPYRLAATSEVITEAGTFRVTQVGPVGLVVEVDGLTSSLLPGDDVVARRRAIPSGITAEGPRLVITGSYLGPGAPKPVIWSSADSGTSWDTFEPAVSGTVTAAALLRKRIAAFGRTFDDEPGAWAARWDTAAAEASAIEALRAYISAINRRDAAAMSALLPHDADRSTPPRFQIPSLGELEVDWWSRDTFSLDTVSIAQTFDYLEALNTEILISDCTSAIRLGQTDSLRVICEVQVTSDLLTVLARGDGARRIEGVLEDGSLKAVSHLGSPLATPWQMLIFGTGDAAGADWATLATFDDAGRAEFDPTFTRESAAVHLRLANSLVRSVLRPGDTRVAATPFGTMEWQWIDSPPAPVYSFDDLTHTPTGFIAIAQEEFDEFAPPEVTLWSSPDGLDWFEIPTPPGIQGIWNLQPFQDGFIVAASRDEESLLMVFDGSEWSEVTFPPPPDGFNGGLGDVVISGDHILAFTEAWQNFGPDDSQAWLIGTDNTPRQTTVPEEALSTRIGVVGSDEGFIIATSGGDHGGAVALWHSSHGATWRQIADAATIEDAQYLWGLEQHRNKYFVGGEIEPTCSAPTNSDPFCRLLPRLWTSVDGVAWDQVVTKNGEPVAAYGVGSGPLGLAAVSEETDSIETPRSLYFSPDAETWERSADLVLLYPDVAWWWLNNLTVGNDTIIITGSAYDANSVEDVPDMPFFIIGRVIDS